MKCNLGWEYFPVQLLKFGRDGTHVNINRKRESLIDTLYSSSLYS